MIDKIKSQKPMVIMLILLGIIFGIVFGYKLIKNVMIKKYLTSQGAPVVTVAATKIGYELWHPILKAPGTIRAVKGVDITTELAGLVRRIVFIPGQMVKMNDVLVELNDDTEVAQLHSLQATEALAEIVYNRDKAQYEVQAISKALLDQDAANLKNQQALVAQQASIVAKKTLRAPFDGRLGINLVNPGQFLNPGDKVVTLQSLNPIYVDFTLPQQTLIQLDVGQSVQISTDAYPGRIFTGKITTIDPQLIPLLETFKWKPPFKIRIMLYCQECLATWN